MLVVGTGPWGDAVAALLSEHAVLSERVGAGVELVEVDRVPQRMTASPRPDVAVITDADPGDLALVSCLAAGVPVVDVHRSMASVDRARDAMRAGTLVAAPGWAGSVAGLVVAAAERRPGAPEEPAEHVDVDVLLDAGDSASDAWWRRFSGLHRSFMVYDRGQRRLVRGLGEPKVVTFGQLRRRARRIASPEQETLVETGHASSAAVRVAFARVSTNVWLALLVGSGAWRFLPVAVRRVILRPRPGGAPHQIDVTALTPEAVVRARVVDPRGRAHLVAASAAVQVERLLDPGRTVPEGVSHPEESDDPEADLARLRALGVTVDVEVHRISS